MKTLKRKTVATAVLLVVAASLAADDGLLLSKNLSGTPDSETEFAGINMAKFDVLAQKSNGTLLTEIVYKDFSGLEELFSLMDAKPLVQLHGWSRRWRRRGAGLHWTWTARRLGRGLPRRWRLLDADESVQIRYQGDHHHN